MKRVILILFALLMPMQAVAISNQSLEAIQNDTIFYVPDDVGTNCPAGAAVPLTSSEAAPIIWNYLTGKGLSAVQAAGIMGNLQAESGFNPGIQERGTGIGFGLAQWSFGRRKNLEKAAADRGVPVSDLTFQLDFLWGELEGPYKKEVLDPLRATNDLSTATNIVLLKFERPKHPNLPARLALAQNILNQFGGGAAAGASVAACGSVTAANVIQKISFSMGGTIKPTAIILHWWGGGGGIDSLISTLNTRKLSVQIGTTTDGKVYQLTPQLNSHAEHAKCANTWAIGNEIEGGVVFGKDPAGSGADVALDLANNDAQFKAVVGITSQLMKQYNIPLDGTIAPDGKSGSGVHSHKEVDPHCSGATSKIDVDDVYLKRVKDELRKQGFK
jgi:hypothetical protein